MFTNHVVAIALLLSYLAPYISPEKHWSIAFFGLTYPIWVMLNVLFMGVWFVKIPKRSLYSLIIVLSGWSQLSAFIQTGTNDTDVKIKGAIKVMSYNVKLFDLYNWNKNMETRKLFFELIKKESPNIMCFQEFYTSDAKENHHDNLDTLL